MMASISHKTPNEMWLHPSSYRTYQILIFGVTWILFCDSLTPARHATRRAAAAATMGWVPPKGATAAASGFSTRLCAQRGTAGKTNDATVVALIHSHHLLDHQPDTMILKGGKHKLRGVACLGRPGMALCLGAPKSLSKFRAALESAMPQKRFKTKILEDVSPSDCDGLWDGFERVTTGDFRRALASIGKEDEFAVLTGIAVSPAAEERRPSENQSTNKKKKKRKRK